MPRGWRRELLCLALLTLLALLGYGSLLEGDEVPYSPHSDFVTHHLAIKQVAHRSWQEGRGLPFWRSDVLSGGPALTHPQALYTHPLQLLFLPLDPLEAAGPTVFLHVLVMGVACLALGGALGLATPARLLLAAAGLFNFKLILMIYAGWLPVISAFVCLPLLFASLFRLLDRPGPRSSLALAAAGFLCLHAGHLQLFYYSVLLLAPYALGVCVVRARSGRRAEARGILLGSSAAGLLAVASSAYLLLPLAAEAPLTSRVDASFETFLSRPNFSIGHLVTFLQPEILGTPLTHSYRDHELWEDGAYFGIVPTLLALAGAWLGRRRPHVAFLTVAFGASILLAVPSPITRLLYDLLPGFALFRSPPRFLFLTGLLGTALAGFAVDEWGRRVSRERVWLRTGVVVALFAIVVGEGLYHARRYVTTAPKDLVLPPTRYQEILAGDPGAHRIAPLGRFTLNYGWAASLGLELVTGFDAYNYRHYQDFVSVLKHGRLVPNPAPVWTDLDRIARPDLLDALNVRYVVSRQALSPVPDGYRRLAHLRDEPIFLFYRGFERTELHVYENRNARARAFWAEPTLPARSAADALGLLQRHDLGEHTIVEWGDQPALAPEAVGGGPIRILEARGGQLRLEATTARRGLLVLAETWHPGWHAHIDGEPAPLLRANLTALGLVVPEGSHRIELEFEPLLWPLARAVTLAGGAGFVLLFGFCCLRGPSARGAGRQPGACR